ncbi:hypothetical protein Misp05_30780 [Micromonospora sp. NBRC 107095]|nr:hypothetical protein Misp05_30780 [Micromonospora sp. NBRC 107095]
MRSPPVQWPPAFPYCVNMELTAAADMPCVGKAPTACARAGNETAMAAIRAMAAAIAVGRILSRGRDNENSL